MYLVIALGNPGVRYALTRHNAGFIAMDELADIYNLKFKNTPKFQAYAASASPPLQRESASASPHLQGGDREGKTADGKIIFAMPLTYMNESGITVSRIANFHKIFPKNIIVIHDELDLPLGKIRVSFGASAGGHNGVLSIIRELGTKNFIRLRIGIGNEISEARKIPSEKFVLQKFTPAEQKIFTSNLSLYTKAVYTILKEGHEKAMAEFN
ncbi:hypothetical protein A2Y83_01920 [Candidatus Falkowbacteria bacterium RBG_13_39_14]|uniref:Peptidyl-tRNA hydrolase n=1 Tax=Candidatus Falkowbacteria bacterium RBG_13_39_14 TaxID=1797985 RepID=A0A1F5S1G1_9BACT|nr:MAG: hypothetical protein A2Y83_01920 [Candidatus Falkowbacteria bacterium RBG_13_39_14]